jgi:HSP20 family protein
MDTNKQNQGAGQKQQAGAQSQQGTQNAQAGMQSQQSRQSQQSMQSAQAGMQSPQTGTQSQQTAMQAQPGEGSSGERGVTTERRPGSGVGVLRPPVDVIEDATGITLVADMPGVSKDNLNLRLAAQSLTVEGSLSLDLPADMESRYAEVRHQHYERTFALSRELDGEKATAELAHGVLTIRIPKTAEAAPRKIPVNVAS